VISLKFFDHMNYYELVQKVYPALFLKIFICAAVILLASLAYVVHFPSLYNKAEKASEKENGMTIEETWGCARLEGVSK